MYTAQANVATVTNNQQKYKCAFRMHNKKY